MIVCKFGGSCTARAEAIKNIKELATDTNRKVFVFSAIGREGSDDKKITDLLIDYTNGDQCAREKIFEKYNKLLEYTNLRIKIKGWLNRIFREYSKHEDRDKLLSRGEFLTAKIMSKYLNIKFIRAEKVLFFNNDQIDWEKSSKKAGKYLEKYKRIVIPGFYGNDHGKIKLFSRGGGDVSGAYISRMLSANTYENWTDVDGVHEVNPKILSSRMIETLSYNDLAFMTSLDAGVIHKDCASILGGTNITLKVKSIFAPQKEGTQISKNNKNSSGYICFAQCGDCVEIYLCKSFEDYIVFNSTKEKFREDIKNLYLFLKSIN